MSEILVKKPQPEQLHHEQHPFFSLLRTHFADRLPNKQPQQGVVEPGVGIADGSVERDDWTGEWLAHWLDAEDRVGELRQLFHVPRMETLPGVDLSLVKASEESIYLCGNSLGLQPKCTREFVERELRQWAEMGVHGHFTDPEPWIHCDDRLLEDMARLVGACSTREVGLMNSTTVNIHLLFTAFFRPTQTRYKVLLEARAFPSDHYALESQLRLHGLDPKDAMICLEPRPGEECLRTEDILDLLAAEGPSIAIVFFSAVQYYTGQLFDMERITKFAKQMGCLAGWDLAHAIGNVPLKLHEWEVPFACWCNYKYVCAGPGTVGGLFVHENYTAASNDNIGEERRLLGWWGHRLESRFRMDNRMELAEGVAGFRLSTPPALLMACVRAFLHVMARTSMEELRRKSLLLTGYLEFLLDTRLPGTGTERHAVGSGKSAAMACSIITPREPAQRGCQLSLKFTDCRNADIDRLHRKLARRGVVVDKRHPDVLRATPVHLYNSFRDVWRFVQALFDSLEELMVEGQEEETNDGSGEELK